MSDIVTGFSISHPGVYELYYGERILDLSQFRGKQLSIHHNGELSCCYCSRPVKKLFQNGYCFPCVRKLARCDLCILRPELCHFHLGTCREEDWGLSHCMQPHVVYVAWTSSLKVGVTRKKRVRSRWQEQGAVGATVILETKNRLQAGLIESHMAKTMADKTNWRQMLATPSVDESVWENQKSHVLQLRDQAIAVYAGALDGIEIIDRPWQTISYQPMIAKAVALKITANEIIEGEILGFKGHYMIMPQGVINIRQLVGRQITMKVG